MRTNGRNISIASVVILGGLAGWFLTRTAVPDAETAKAAPQKRPPGSALYDPAPRASKLGERPDDFLKDPEASEAGALQNQRSLVFADRAAMLRFLEAARGRGISILGSIDRLNALHVGFLSLSDLQALLDGTEDSGFVFPVDLPPPLEDGVQEGAIGFGSRLLSWLGITGDNSAYGTGVKIGILDTGSTLEGAKNFFLVNPPANAADWNGHGTAVADLIRQIAPAADLLSWRVADDTGASNSFLMAKAVLEAVDSGVNIINISMGSYGNSNLFRQAIEFAQESGVFVYASTGNEGYDMVAYPAAYSGVVGVGAVDAAGAHLNFSNTGNVAMSAPGLDLLTAWSGGQQTYFSGTSAAAPIGVGVLAAAMSSGGTRITAESAYQLVTSNLNESGAPGYDALYGSGTVDFGRILRSNQSGITDAALASNYVTIGATGQPVVQVTVENRGTSTLLNTPVEVNISGAATGFNITTLLPGRTQTFTLPLNLTSGSATVVSTVGNSAAGNDFKPSNNRRTDVFVPQTPN